MSLICLSPQEFVGYDILLEYLFSIITIVVALFASKVYKITGNRQIRLFSTGFLFIFLGYITQALFSSLILLRGGSVVCEREIYETLLFNTLGFYSHVIFSTIGLLILVYMTFKKSKPRVLWFILTMAMIGTFYSQNIFHNFYTITTLSFLFLAWHFVENYMKKKNSKTLLVASAFVLLTISSSLFLLAINQPNVYVIGKLFELTAYVLIITNFYLITKVT